MSKNKSAAISFDWFSVTVKPDVHSVECDDICLHDVLRFFSFSNTFFSEFIDLGAKQHYDHCYYHPCGIRIYAMETGVTNDITRKFISATEPDKYKAYQSMGFNVEMSGQGCRFYEEYRGSVLHENESGPIWFGLFAKLLFLTDKGFSVNFTRIDIALDSYDGTITVDKVREALFNGEIVTLFRVCTDSESEPVQNVKRLSVCSAEKIGDSITIGNRRSNTHVCIYDKLLEQRHKYKNDSVALYKLGKLAQWTRFEMRIKNDVANAFVSGLVDVLFRKNRFAERDISVYIGSFINSKIRFISRDNSRKSRCSLKNWWLDFVGSCMRLKFSFVRPVQNVYRHTVNYVKHSLSPTLFSLIMRMSPEGFLTMVEESAEHGNRFKDKHMRILNSDDSPDEIFASSDYWKGIQFSSKLLKARTTA